MSKVYDAAPSVPRVACAVEVWSTAAGSQARATPARSRWAAIISPWWSDAKLVASRVGRPSRARATATLAALPPAYSWRLPLRVCTTSTRDSPTTSTPRSMCRLYHVGWDDRRVSDPSDQRYRVFGLMGAGDLVAGLVCAAIGLSQDIQVLAIVGTVLVLSGAGMLAYVVWSKS